MPQNRYQNTTKMGKKNAVQIPAGIRKA